MDKKQKTTLNPKKTKDNKCFQYAITAALNYRNIGHHPERIYKHEPFINNYNWKDIEFPSYSKDWAKFEQNNKTIALNILFVPYNTKEIRQAYISKYNKERNNQVNLLMITDGTNNWHFLAVKTISGLTRGIISNHNGDIECLLKKIKTYQNNKTEKKAIHRPSGYSLITCCLFDKSKKEQKYYEGKDCIKIFCKDLKDQAIKIINHEKKEMIPLTNDEKETH